MSIWDFLSWFFWAYIIISCISILITVLIDIFRDSSLSGVAKAGWLILLVFIPFFAAFIYVIARGAGMASRNSGGTGGGSAAREIESAKKMLDAGTINEAEFSALKAKALA
jgi:CBS domain containing-hemolysin-like protein